MARILLIDDEEYVRTAIKNALSAAGHEVAGAADGRLKTAGGAVELGAPQVADRAEPFRSRLREVEHAKPFVWTKAKVHQRRVKGRRISEL